MRSQWTIAISLVLMTAVFLVGCEAFNDHNQEGEIIGSLSDADLGITTPTTPDTAAGAVICNGVDGITVEAGKIEGETEVPSALNGVSAVTEVTKVAEGVMTVTVTEGDTEFAMTVKSADDAYTACSVGYTVGEVAQTITTGKITIAQFNVAEDDKTMNSGVFELTTTAPDSAAKAAATILGVKAEDTASTASGSYYSESVSE